MAGLTPEAVAPSKRAVSHDKGESGRAPVSVIVCSRNRPRLLADTVTSILEGEVHPAEIVIVDQSDSPNDELRNLGDDSPTSVRYLHSRSFGLSRARNEGIRAARWDLLVFLDDDILVEPTWLNALVEAMKRAGAKAVVTGRVTPGEPEVPDGFAPSTITDMSPRVYRGRISRDVLFSNMAIPRTAIDQIGFFDENLGGGSRFPSAEDNDFGFRLLEAGYAIFYVPEANVLHRAWRPQTAYLAIQWSYGVGQGAFYAKHASVRDPYTLKRLRNDLRTHARRCAHHRWRNPRAAAENGVYAAALMTGAATWLLHGITAGRRQRSNRRMIADGAGLRS